MQDSIQILFRSVPMTVEYDIERDVDYGVEGSPVWDQIEVTGIKIGGVEVIEMFYAEMVEDIGEQILEELND